jgi:phytoene dehydrogenase-like protein
MQLLIGQKAVLIAKKLKKCLRKMKSKAEKTAYDAVVVGAGPNGLAAAITMQKSGLSVLLIEGSNELGGGLKCGEITIPGFTHDRCAAVFPLAACSPFFSLLPAEWQPEFVYPQLAVAHPFNDGNALSLEQSVRRTADRLGKDSSTYYDLFAPLLESWPTIVSDFLLKPLHFDHLIGQAKFGSGAFLPASVFAKKFEEPNTKAFFAGMAAHSMLPLSKVLTSAFGMMLLLAAHTKGWPIAKGGSGKITNNLVSYFIELGGKIETDFYVSSLMQLPSSKAILFDLGPPQLLKIAGEKFSAFYKWQMKRFRYGPGVFKMDWALSDQAPFKNTDCRSAVTVHLGGSIKEISESEKLAASGSHSEKPFVIFVQPSILDPSRAPADKHTAWAYCHSPAGSKTSMEAVVEKQIERFAPGFQDCILAKRSISPQELENFNSNYIGGDISGGTQDIYQFFTRPALRLSPYRTSAKGIYICSSSAPPGGGVHGVCGMRAAKRAMKDIFNIGRRI